MANLTREAREKKELEEKEKMRAEIEAQIRLEMESKKSDKTLEEENEILKKKLAEMEHALKSANSNYEASTSHDTESGTIPIEMNARILVTSMTNGGVNMKTATDGSARHFRLEKIGQTIPIIYEHLINCINTDRWLFEEGLVYINDEKVVKEQVLEDFYKKFITPDKIENIMEFDTDTIKTMIGSATRTIQETIALLVAQKINDGGYIDMNKVEIIGSACNPQIDIRNLANSLR